MAKDKAAGQNVSATMVLEKECKACNRFKAADADAAKVMATVYIDKAALETIGNPDKVVVTVAAG